MTARALVLAVVLFVMGESAHAQGGAGVRAAIRANRRAAQQQQKQDTPPAAARQQLQQQIRRTLWRVTKERIGFSDEQMLRLERTSQRFDQERRQLAIEERSVRVGLRREILADSTANQSTIASALDRMHGVQQRRLDLQAEEQKEFSSFMTPLQRARFGALQEQVRKRLQEFDRARAETRADVPQATP